MVHLTDQRAPTGAALCGAAPAGRKASLSRNNGGPACNVCLRLYRSAGNPMNGAPPRS